MGSDTGRDTDASGLDEYWRRRAVALIGVVGVVGLLTWACAGGGDDGKPPHNAAEVAGASPGVPPAPTAMPTVTVTATTKATATATSTAATAPAAKDGDACAPGDVVIAMAVTRATYAGGDRPTFRVTAVNTGKRTCTFDVGSRALDVRITSGPDQVWSSAQCGRGDGSSVKTLRRGVPYVDTVGWDRKRGSDGCKGDRRTARPGTYVATVKAAGAKVDDQVFHLR
ncbi:hypothetical protein [Actinomadura xylanilytica]|uniref:hypothetical protein n=1 Tax=Actinomadura xylanilytica TaxID=887459 RepID=UPI00255A97E6|nr:hypothetical protein [Actinomadura xylanilytica]MDL4777710.1 hypothetical protein [Actinomadura xylanilytica]